MNIIKRVIKKIESIVSVSVQRTHLGEGVFLAHHAEVVDSNIDDFSSIGRYTKIRETNIGKYCSISWNCTLGAPAHPLTTLTSCAITYKKRYGIVDNDVPYEQKTTTIGNDVWIGCNAVIIAGVSIGNGAVIGAGAICTHDIPPYEIWAGVPAKKIADRYSNSEWGKRVNELEWWNWSTQKKKDAIALFSKELDEDVLFELEKIKKEIENNPTQND